MIELLTNLPPQVIGFKAKGEITKDDYEQVVFPEIKKQTDRFPELNYIFYIDTSLKNFSVAAWMYDAWLGLKEMARWHKVAIVSDSERVRGFTDKAGTMAPGEYKGFAPAKLDRAIQWAAA